MRNFTNNNINNSNQNDKTSNDKNKDSNIMKRPLTLDLNKKLINNGVLSTPDVNMCKLASPDLEHFILNTNTLETPTPSGIFPPKVS